MASDELVCTSAIGIRKDCGWWRAGEPAERPDCWPRWCCSMLAMSRSLSCCWSSSPAFELDAAEAC